MLQKDRSLMERIKRFVEDYALANHGNTPTMAEIRLQLPSWHSGGPI